MPRNYRLGNKADMKRFSKDLKAIATEKARSAVMTNGVEVECPNCGRKIIIRPNMNKCLGCGVTIKMNLDF